MDATFVRLNLFLLLIVSFFPFPTRLLAGHIAEENAERVATTVYGLTLLLASSIIAGLWRYALHVGLTRAEWSDEADRLTARLTPGWSASSSSSGSELPSRLAACGYLIIAVFFVVPLPFTRSRQRSGDGDRVRSER